MHQERLQNKEARKTPTHPSKDIASSAAANARQSVSVPRSEPRATVGSKQSSLAVVHQSTGPRTAAGKQKSSRNALKNGIFSKFLILKSESRADFGALRRGLLNDLQPEGTLETALVESLVMILWRKARLLRAENAEIAKAAEFQDVDLIDTQLQELWDRSRQGETAGGMLRPSSNRLVVQGAILLLRVFREQIKKFGFQEGPEPRLLRKLYGFDRDGSTPYGVPSTYQVLLREAKESLDRNDGPDSADEPRKEMMRILDREIEWLTAREEMQQTQDDKKEVYGRLAALVPPQDAMDRLVRYEAHLGREFDRILNQLERVQRMRRGQPAPPTLNVNVST